MSIYIEKSTYTCYDWHDWRSWTEILGDESRKYAISEDPMDVIVEDVLDGFDVTDAKTRQEVQEEMHFFDVAIFDAVSFWHTDGSPAEMTKVLLKKENASEYTVKWSSSYSYEVHYEIKEIPNEDVVYLPIRQYLCFPKVVPNADRTVFPYTASFDEAKKWLAEFPSFMDHTAPFEESSDLILVGSRQEFDRSVWYNKQAQMNQILKEDEKRFAETFHPLTNVHAKDLGLDTASED